MRQNVPPPDEIKQWADTTITEEEKTMMVVPNEGDHRVHEEEEDHAAGVFG